MISSRNPIRCSIATLILALSAVPAAAQSATGTFALTGMSNAALWATASGAPGAATTPRVMLPATAGVATGAAEPRRFVADSRIVVARSAARPTAPARQAQDGGGGFPWLEVGIGAAVGALFLQAVATANSGDAAELPRGGVSIVLPSS